MSVSSSVATVMTKLRSGTTSMGMLSFEITAVTSETGSDFQNRYLFTGSVQPVISA